MKEIRELISVIGENQNVEQMQELGDMLAEIICFTYKGHPEIAKEYKMRLHVMAYGKVLTYEMAEDIVEHMKPYGEHWNIEQTNNVKSEYGITDISDVDFYTVMNMAYNDYKDIFSENLEMYVKFTKAFIQDEDAQDKVFNYFTMIPRHD